MEPLLAVVDAVVSRLPQCVSCESNICQVYVRALFTCWHFLCATCEGGGTHCPHCQQQVQRDRDLAVLGEIQLGLSAALNGFYSDGRTEAFGQVCGEFYKLIVFWSGRQQPSEEIGANWRCPRCSAAVLQPCVNCANCCYVNLDLVTTVQDTDVWVCSCGYTNALAELYCACGAEKASSSEKLQENKESLPSKDANDHSVPTHADTGPKEYWTCEQCGFALNASEVCENCDNRSHTEELPKNGKKRSRSEGRGESQSLKKRKE